MSDLSRRIASLTPKQRALLEKRLQAAGIKAAQPDTIPVLPKAEAYELSFGQQRLWFIDQLAPGSPAYNIPFAGRLAGPLDVDLLQRALDEIVRRHEILRTTFPLRDGRPVQVVTEAVHAPIRYDHVPDEEEAQRRVLEEARIPFDLVHGPVLRIRLLRLAAEDHMLLVTMPHIVTDAWSMAVFFRELPALYEAFAAGQPSPLPELPIQFRDYAAWQRGELQGEKLESLVDFWKSELADAPALLELPGDFPRPAVHRFRGLRYELQIPPEVTRAVRELARREGVTMFMMMVAVFSILLQRYSGQDDILIGSPVATRERPETEGLIGFFINTLVVRTQLKERESFRELLARVRERCLAAFSHQELPFEKLVEVLGLDRDLSHQPLVQVTLVLQNVHIPPPRFERLRLTHFQQTDSRTAKVDLMLGLWEAGGEDLNGWIEYNVDLFAHESIERMGRHFVTLLRSIVDGEPALMDEEERRLIESWNATERDYPREATIGELFDEQVALRPEAVAVEMGEERLTYRELAERADALAARLHGASRVGLLLDRGIERIVAMLATIKAGAAYVPLDPAYPEERLNFMIDDAGVDLLWSGGQAILPVRRGGGRGNQVTDRQDCLSPTDVAYIMYTSGSTGRPKGVIVPHRAVIRLVKNQTYADMTPEETFLHFAPHTFDAATFEIWGALLNGGRLVIQPPGRASLDDLAETIGRHGVTIVFFTTGLFHAIVDGRVDALRGLRQVLAGGELISAAHVKKFLRAYPGVPFIHCYGPTEATTFATARRVTDPDSFGATLPIGKPLANTKAYVLDKERQPVPIGVAGELFIGGDAVALGYTNGERFEGLYRTGDRVRWNAEGELEFLGRLDDQVKIRGFRIEPGEIEAVLREHPEVTDAVVVAKEKTLIAYVTPPPAPDLREYVRSRLPEHMVPAHVVGVDAFPLTPNGKVDRRALAARPIEREEAPEVDARTPAEETLAAIWRDVLKLDRVGIHQNFFDAGGDSIRALLVVSRAHDAGLPLTPAMLFENPTIAGLAEAAQRASEVTADDEPPVGPVPLTPIARWFFERVDRDHHHFNMALPLRCRRDTDPALVERALNVLIAHHDALRIRAERDHSGQWRMWIAPVENEPPLRLQRIERSELDALQASLDLVAGPVVRAAWLETDGDPELLIVAHHLAVDAVSLRILLADLERAYSALEKGATPRLPPPALSFRSWARKVEVEDRQSCLSTGTGTRGQAGLPVLHRQVALDLDEAERAYRMSPDELVLAAFLRALGAPVQIDVEHHGRDTEVDLSRTVGWFTRITPRFFGDVSLQEVKERARAERGDDFGSSDISFNFLGSLDVDSPSGRFTIADVPTGTLRSPRASAPYRLSLDAYVLGGVLHLHLTGGDDALADAVVAELHALAEAREDAEALAPSDFPEADLDADELQRLMSSLQGKA